MNSLQTLIVDRTSQPHRIVGWQDAICALVTGDIESLEDYEATVSSPSVTLSIPCVARLTKMVSRTKDNVKFSRINVYTRDNYRCCYCGEKFPPKKLTYDHVLPVSRGGPTTWTNIVTSCGKCNRRKGGRTPQQAGMKMHFKPYRPKSLPMARPLVVVRNVPEQWKPYLTFSDVEDVQAVG